MTESTISVSGDPMNWAMALTLLAIWLLASWRCMRRPRLPAGAAADCIVVFASQTGHGEDIARHLHARIAAHREPRGTACKVFAANHLTAETMAAAKRIFFVLSTTGEGEAPDNGRQFETRFLRREADLAGKRVAVLALGDRRYRHFCGFGRKVADWATRCGANIVQAPVCVDDLSPQDLSPWDDLLTREGFPAPTTDPELGLPTWTIARREQVAKASFFADGAMVSDGLHHLVLRASGGAHPQWQIGDLFELTTQDGHLRDYSIANLPGSDELHLFVRRVVENGKVGRGSGMLTGAGLETAQIPGRIRQHPSFRPPSGDGPLLAIGAGSGWAGLRPHLLHAIAQQRRCWLIFGERGPDDAGALLGEMRSWIDDGSLHRLDLALSHGGGPYVQDILADHREQVRHFLDAGGEGDSAIILCGRLAMGQSCLEILAKAMGPHRLDEAREAGRLRHDFY